MADSQRALVPTLRGCEKMPKWQAISLQNKDLRRVKVDYFGMVQNPLFLGNITDHQRARQ
jgi:hypothetical protein